MNTKKLLDYLLKNNIDNKLFMLAFFVAFVSYSFWQPIEEMLEFAEHNKGSVFYIGIAFSFCCYTSAYMFTKWDKWRWFPMFVVLICIGRLLVEVLFVTNGGDPEAYDYTDYINFLITPFIVFNYYVSYRYKQMNKG